MAIALQSWTISGKPIQTDTYPLGFVTSKPKSGLFTVDARITVQYAAGESLSLAIVAVHADGTNDTILNATLDDTLDVGVTNLLEGNNPGEVLVGDILHVAADYTAGGGPASPLVALLVQVG